MVRIKINICYLIQQIFRYRAAPAEEGHIMLSDVPFIHLYGTLS